MSALAGVGVVAAAAAAAASILLAPSRARSLAMLLALALFPVLIAGDQWHSAAISDLRDTPARLAALALAAIVLIAALGLLFSRRPLLLPLAVVAALPFRVPLHAGGDQANLLVPLYLVIAGGVLATALGGWRSAPGEGTRAAAEPEPTGPAPWLPRIVAAVVVLYALQTLYSDDFSQGLQNACFFFVPFSIAFALLVGVRWDRRLLVAALAVVTAEALLFVAVGMVEYASRELLWNGAVIRSNEFHVYFRVNSLFWDPNVYGRYLALVIVALTAALLFTRQRRAGLALALAIGFAWLGLATTFSQSSFAALLAGIAVLAALRWSLRWTALACAGGAIGAAVFVLAAGGSLKIDLSSGGTVNKDTSGRANLISGGAELFGNRPIAGYGSGSFSTAFRRNAGGRAPVSESHTEPITIAAEQGLLGLTLYLALLATALWTMLAGLRELMPGLGRGPPARGPAGPLALDRGGGTYVAARAAVLAMFVALIVHTLAYAGFYEDPITWVLLAISGSLAIRPSA
ncbi:MAG: O-antigen ligase family protein [Solirubrobacterales bacterium]